MKKKVHGGAKEMSDVIIKKMQCKHCRKMFIQGHALEKYCSDECRYLHKKITQNEYKRRRLNRAKSSKG